MPIILAFDCSTPTASVALRMGERIIERNIEHGRQAAELVATIDTMLTEQQISYTDLHAIVTTRGPGSFTGLRIALAALHGLVLAAQTPVKTLTSLEAIAWDIAVNTPAPNRFLVAIDAGKGEVFAQHFCIQAQQPHAEDTIRMIATEHLKATAPVYGNTAHSKHDLWIAAPRAALLCTIADRISECELGAAIPLYIRAPDAKPPKPFSWLATEAS